MAVMEEIIKKANELGLMIKGTDLAARLDELSSKLNADNEAKTLLDGYIKVMQEFEEKENQGKPIEVNEKKQIQEMSEKVSQNQLIKEFIATQSYFVEMMMAIQSAITEPKGEPIKESKIITPGSAGKIITGV